MTLTVAPFRNEPFTDFSNESNAHAMQAGLDAVATQLGRDYPIVIGGERLTTGDILTSVNPSETSEVVGRVHRATREMADQAINTATTAFESWKRVPAVDRARYLFAAAAEMRRRKMEWSAWLVYEIGKSWAEADGDVAEAIDFMEFYAREAIRYGQPIGVTQSPLKDEINQAFYIPLGVGLVIPPWNFPLAIMVGMTTAAIAAGNTVVLKPSSDTPVIAAKFVELMEKVSLPAGVLNFLPCSGGAVGDFLVEHPKTRFIAFTGSMEVGLRINELAAKRSPGQLWIKRVVAEMGGKDTIVVDETADLDAAAEGIVSAAFGFSGQKCSACSRAVIVEDVYDAVLERVVERTNKLRVGPSKDPRNFTGPVASKSAYKSILEYIEIGKGEGRVVAGGGKLESAGDGYFIEPTVIADVDPNARISQEEIFGPVLAVIKAQNFDQALDIANNTEFGLTGALYSQKRERLERARTDFHVGNLYLNRKCTGALVDVHPFGGFNMSGTDSKAGGRDYLLLFLQAKSVAEKF
ncbi:MAG: L-glutamate gamma-semialdehyde dehydrogenase [Blastocatellia bacterium]|nr:L-glutamate gamma-semialdehyde dehydrogenase [Blastocatellia bacterium]